MNMEAINSTIREFERETAALDLELSKYSHSTPNHMSKLQSQVMPDSGVDTAHTLLDDKIDKSTRGQSKFVQFGAIAAENVGRNDNDLSLYLYKEEKQSGAKRCVLVPSENIWHTIGNLEHHFTTETDHVYQNYNVKTPMNQWL